VRRSWSASTAFAGSWKEMTKAVLEAESEGEARRTAADALDSSSAHTGAVRGWHLGVCVGRRSSKSSLDRLCRKVTLGGPENKQAQLFDTNRGGLWLMTEGAAAIGLASTTVLWPAANPPTRSCPTFLRLGGFPTREHLYPCAVPGTQRNLVSARRPAEQGAGETATGDRSESVG
jgi:hypothetical protein